MAIDDEWENEVELIKQPFQSGTCSRGFIIDKAKLRLKANQYYVIRVREATPQEVRDVAGNREGNGRSPI